LTADDKKYLNIAMPAALEGVFMILLCNADLIMVGVLGTSAIAAVSIFTQPRMIILCVARSIASAVTLTAAKYFGMDRKADVAEFLKQTLFVGVIVLGAIHAAFYFALDKILIWMGANQEYLGEATAYAEIALVAVFFTSVTAILQAVMIGFGQTKIVLVTNVQGNLLNIILNAVFIFVLGWGVAGAAIGTVAGTLYTLIYTVAVMRREKLFDGGKILPDKKYFQEVLPVFGGVFSEQGFERIGMVLYTRMVAELGTLPYAVHSICMNFCDFYYSFAAGLGKSSMVLAGQATGKNNLEEREKFLKIGVKFGIIFSVASFVLTFIFRNEILSCYSDDAQVLALGNMIMVIVAAVSFPEAHAMICAGFLRGVGKTSQVAAYSFVSITILRPLITAFMLYVLNLGLVGAWLALAIDQSLRATISWTLIGRLQETTKNAPQLTTQADI